MSDWMNDALCAEVGTKLFFPEKGASTRPAKRICGDCPVAAMCLQYALDEGIEWGIWGGKSPQERREIRRGKTRVRFAAARISEVEFLLAYRMDGEQIADALKISRVALERFLMRHRRYDLATRVRARAA